MSINRINAQTVANIYNTNSNKVISKVNKKEETDRIEISSLGKSLKDYSLDNNIDNTKKVEEIREKIVNGTYSVDAKLTARSILDSIKEGKS
ncbi:flagellar biosynthesis anti-sigma factor FlgM [Clostridium uliginosum]|uniref:Negative regulator of flagellin synthesis n=1 Tax=Clostridium uliginosum TaxID=119641 RepID=A0A1I1KI23_9CLOT|nr:flagellar biosynthesis anti-sigma factor FlgM [Clostridium uliginosum]SFC60429.1 negative regulator of flagellin synthesis FlgM [Clostridium uliginosum]